jgi:hypothetical protein
MSVATALVYTRPQVLWRSNCEGAGNQYDQKLIQTGHGDQRRQHRQSPPHETNGFQAIEWLPILHFKEHIVLSGSWAGPSSAATPLNAAPDREPASLKRRQESRFKPLSLKEMADLPPPGWLIDGLVPQDGLAVLYGEPAAGKSFLALDWGLSIATGTPWLGREVKHGEVVYIYAEGARGLTWRAEAWFQEHGKDQAPSFWAVPVAVPIPSPDERSEFVKAVRTVSRCPRLIIIDTLARNFGDGNESLAQDMSAFVRGCDDLRAKFPGATVLVVHHPGKDQKKGARGSVALKGAAEAEFELTRRGDEVKLTNEKQKDGEEAKPISLELARVKLPGGNTSRVVRPTDGGMVGAAAAEPAKVDPRIVKTDAGLLKALAEYGSGGATLSQWERAADRANDTFYKSRDRLVTAGKVRFDKETARYVVVEPVAGPGPGLVQNGSKLVEVQEVSPVSPL